MSEGVYMVNDLTENLRLNSYGNITRAGNLSNGRVMYNVIDSDGNRAGNLSVPQNQVDTFETSYKQILESAHKIHAYVKENSSEEAIKKRRNLSRATVAASGIIGAISPLIVLRKSTSITKKILGTVAGIITGLSIGFAASLGITTPPGAVQFAKATRTLAKLDIQPVLDEQA